MLNAALKLASAGLAVFPCRVRDKRPATANGCRDATRDPTTIKAWWGDNPDLNLAIACGPPSGIFVIDIDGDVGEAWLHRFEQNNEELPTTVISATSRGRHLYFKWPGPKEIRTSAGRIADGIDVRGLGGYVLAPPSVHPSGHVYRWEARKGTNFAEAPAWLLALLDARARNDYTPASSTWRNLDPIVEGTRNETLASLAGYLIRAHLDIHLIRHIVQLWNAAHCVPPLDDDEASNVVASVARTHLRNYPHA
jgi:hypothetical protein